MNAPAIKPDSAGMPKDFLRYGLHLRRTCGTVQISGKPKQMLRIGHAADLGIVRRAPDAGAAAVHNGNRHTQPMPDFVHGTYHGFLWFHREPTTTATGAPEFRTLEIPDILPPVCAALRLRGVLWLLGQLSGSNDLPDTCLRPDAEYPIHRKPVIPLECLGGAAGVIAPNTIDFPSVIPKVQYQAMHHPFTAPMLEDEDKMLTDKANCRARAYDIVLNGTELGGGSIRINTPEMQTKSFEALGISDEDIQERFGHLVNAFQYGAPPHGGLAYGLDRLVMLMTGASSIRDVIAFPKVQNASDLMMNCPDVVDEKQLDDLSIAVTRVEEEPEEEE